jgi:hypothetical protein
MRYLKLKTIMAVLLIGLIGPGPTIAQTPVAALPGQLSVAGVQGRTVERQLILRSAEPLSGLQAIPADLQGADETSVLAAGAIQIETASVEAVTEGGGEQVVALPVRINLDGAASGEFKGELLIVHDGGSLSVPVTVKVKDSWPLPLALLLVGILLGVGLSNYKAQVRPRDEILVRISQIRGQIRADADLPAAFSKRMESHLVDAESAIQAEEWEAARMAVQMAEQVWGKWRRNSEDWLDQLAYRAELVKWLMEAEDLDANGNYEREVYQSLEDIQRTTPDLAGPDELREKLRELAEQVNDLLRLKREADEFHEMCLSLPEAHENYAQWQQKSRQFVQRMNNLNPSDAGGRQALMAEMEKEIDELALVIAQQRPGVGDDPGAMIFTVPGQEAAQAMVRMAKRVSSAPAIRSVYSDRQISVARNRLRIFTGLGFVVMIVALAGAGFGQLYAGNAIFGANPWADYFALLGWGFASEASRASITETLRGIGQQKPGAPPAANKPAAASE